jgi:hypothetical protein
MPEDMARAVAKRQGRQAIYFRATRHHGARKAPAASLMPYVLSCRESPDIDLK